MASLSEVMHKKVAGVPVVYLAGGAVVILAVVAYRMKSAPTTTQTDNTQADGANPAGEYDEANNGADYSGQATNGTVVVSPVTPVAQEAVQETNETWSRSAITYLINDKNVAPGDAQTAITLYLQGANLSFDQGGLRDAAIKKLGIPPEPLDTVGSVSSQADAPAQKQFSHFPGTHTVKGNNDNTALKLAGLYYGAADQAHALKIVSNNSGLGPYGTTYKTGTKLAIPVYVSPVYYTTPAANYYASTVAKKSGTSYSAIEALNPGLSWPVAKGTKVRVQ